MTRSARMLTPEPDAETRPLLVAAAAFKNKTLKRSPPDRLTLRPSLGMRFAALVYLSISATVLLGFLRPMVAGASDGRGTGQWFAAGLASLLTLCGLGLLLGPSTIVFDRQSRLMTRRRSLLFVRRRAFSDIRAVQLIPGGNHSGGDMADYRTYQVNLVLDDPARSRENVSNHSHLPSTRETARAIAEFLRVPLLERLEMDESKN